MKFTQLSWLQRLWREVAKASFEILPVLRIDRISWKLSKTIPAYTVWEIAESEVALAQALVINGLIQIQHENTCRLNVHESG